MAGNRTLKLSILADVDDLKKKLNQGSDEVEGFGGKLGEFGKKAAAAFAVAAAAAAAYAGKLLIDGVKSAIEDEAAQAKLAKTLQNVTGATNAQVAAVEAQILKLQLAYGITDTELRPSYERLVRATKDVSEATRLQTLAVDVAAGSGKSLETVSNALAKAYEGNTGALTRLGVGITAAEAKTMTLDQITQKLAETFKGQAAQASDTFQGKMARLQVAFDEAKETVGAKLLPVLTDMVNFILNNLGPIVDWLKEKIKPFTKAIEDNKEQFQKLWDFLEKYIIPILVGALKLAFEGFVSTITSVVKTIGWVVDRFEDLYNIYKKVIDFIKNNPLSKFLQNINPFSNSSYSTSNANYLLSGSGDSMGGFGDNYSNPFFPNVPFVPTQAYLDAIARKEELKKRTAEIRAGIEARNASTSTTATVVVNVNSPSIIDEEGFTRAVIDALNSSEARVGSLATLNI